MGFCPRGKKGFALERGPDRGRDKNNWEKLERGISWKEKIPWEGRIPNFFKIWSRRYGFFPLPERFGGIFIQGGGGECYFGGLN